MSDHSHTPLPDDPDWMETLDDYANDQLSDLEMDTSCDQIHPIIANWYRETLEQAPPPASSAVWQAVACLTTEIIQGMQEDEELAGVMNEESIAPLALWIEDIITLGRAFEIALRTGRLDDL
ncbi:MAG UNVERIFIED_CONTAM: hypothetical protein LVT10_26565 [Anaerolineae bacterium]|jgi:hypothetical protein